MKYIYINIAVTLLISMGCFAQVKDRRLSKGDKLYNGKAYFKSIEVYEKVADNGYKSEELFKKLGDSYFFNAEYPKANKWYSELFKMSAKTEPIYYYRYSQTLKSIGDDIGAALYLEKFSQANKSDSRAVEFAGNKNYLSVIEDNSKRYIVEDAGINTAFSDYGASVYNDKIVFTSSRMPEEIKAIKDNWTSDYYSSLYSVTLSNENILEDVQFFAKEIQSEYHESDAVFSSDGKTMYFTRSNDKKAKAEKGTLLKIFRSVLKNGKWSIGEELPFNSDKFSCAHPALSSDNKTLYFVSNMPGGFGDTDIYKIAISDAYVAFGAPINLGKNINTSGKETFPWISRDNTLYFSSDGHLGLGGLDIFVTSIEKNNFENKVINAGEPINSEFDDFSFIQLADSPVGFFTSNRTGGKGKDDVYRFVEQKQEKQKQIQFCGLVVDIEKKAILPGAAVTIYDQDHNLITTIKSDFAGHFETPTDAVKGTVYYIKAEAVDYETREIGVNTNMVDLEKGIIIELVKIKKNIEKGTDLAKLLNIGDIFFDLGKWNITASAEADLEKVVQVMQDFPEMKIAIGSHTDSRASKKFNLTLSQKRAKSTRDYIISRGIMPDRLTAKGYGETRLLNPCADGVKCSESEHLQNRRSEFIVSN